MLIKHFDNFLKLLNIEITDFVGLRHNCWVECVSLQDASDRQYLEVSERLVRMTETIAWFMAAEHDCPERILVWVKSNTQLIWTYDGTQIRLDDGRVSLIETSAQAYRCIGPAHECLKQRMV